MHGKPRYMCKRESNIHQLEEALKYKENIIKNYQTDNKTNHEKDDLQIKHKLNET